MPKTKTTTPEFVTAHDRLPEREGRYETVRNAWRPIASFYGFESIHPSVAEEPRAFSSLAKAGFFDERAPIGCKTAMGDDFLFRFSGVLSTIRAYVSHKMNDLPHPLKFKYDDEVLFAVHGNRSKTHTRQELGLLMIGEEGPIAEAQITQVIWKTAEALRLDMEQMELRMNATGCQDCRPSFRSPFIAHFRNRSHRLCKNCKRNLKRAPTKILSCEEEQCRVLANNAPQIIDYICEACKKHLRGILEFLDETKIPYFLDPKFFREGSWYNTLIFEASLTPKKEDNQEVPETVKPRHKIVLAEGGRLSKAGELITGRRLDVAAGVLSLEGAAEALAHAATPPGSPPPRVYLAQLGELAKKKSLHLLEELRRGGIEVFESLGRDSVKSQLKVAERLQVGYALILGQKEALDTTIIVREIASGMQETISQEKLVDFIFKKTKKD